VLRSSGGERQQGVTDLIFLAVAALTAATLTNAEELVGRVVRVHDGDTLTVLVDDTQIRVRLTDIDAPELGQAFGKRCHLPACAPVKPRRLMIEGRIATAARSAA
jgi:endonuclease YncB( thermonuclease family)